jgi:hypothetical protein
MRSDLFSRYQAPQKAGFQPNPSKHVAQLFG